MNLPFLGHYKDAKQGGNLLMTPDGHGFRRQRAPQGNKCHYVCCMETKYSSKVTPAVQIDTNMVVMCAPGLKNPTVKPPPVVTTLTDFMKMRLIDFFNISISIMFRDVLIIDILT